MEHCSMGHTRLPRFYAASTIYTSLIYSKAIGTNDNERGKDSDYPYFKRATSIFSKFSGYRHQRTEEKKLGLQELTEYNKIIHPRGN